MLRCPAEDCKGFHSVEVWYNALAKKHMAKCQECGRRYEVQVELIREEEKR